MSWILKTCVWLGAAVVVGGLAVAVKINHLETGVVSIGKTEVSFNITVRGTAGRAVKNAVLSVFDPEQIILGKTNGEGTLNIKAPLSSGRSLILQAEGVAFKMQRTILVPRAASYNASIFFDLAEVHEGNATLISTENSETTALERVPTPAPVVLRFDFQNLHVSDAFKAHLEKLLNETAQKSALIAGSYLSCRNWEGVSLIYECELTSTENKSSARVFQNLPDSPGSAESFFNSFTEMVEFPQSTQPAANELVLAVRHNDNNFRIYADGAPLSLWREKKDLRYFRRLIKDPMDTKSTIELALITEQGQVLQRRISWPTTKKVYTLRIPPLNGIDLSRRDQGSSVPR